MLILDNKEKYYQALLSKDTEYDGVFYVGVKTTGIFCRPTCGARKPKLDNCEFFKTAEEALLASYRPCKRCQPLLPPNQESALIKKLIDAVENNPEKRWQNIDFKGLQIDSSTIRRQFQKRFGMTFVEYARARRMGIAMKQIRGGEAVIDAQISSGYESSSGFRDAFSRIMGAPPIKSGTCNVLKAIWIDTPIGPMIAVGNDEMLFLLEFVDRRGLEREIERLRTRAKAAIIPGQTAATSSIKTELEHYFGGRLSDFKTPVFLLGSDFQKMVWNELIKIPPSETRSYLDIAKMVGRPKAYRAVANANGDNQLAIIIPCHRVINASGELGGYGGGISRKQWLLNHELEKYGHLPILHGCS